MILRVEVTGSKLRWIRGKLPMFPTQLDGVRNRCHPFGGEIWGTHLNDKGGNKVEMGRLIDIWDSSCCGAE
jgi:hypothetical protein